MSKHEPKRLDGVTKKPGSNPLSDGQWYETTDVGSSLTYDLSEVSLSTEKCLYSDVLVDGDTTVMFDVELRTGDTGLLGQVFDRVGGTDSGDEFELIYQVLPKCQARVRLPLSLLELNSWLLDREGAFLKPLVGGDRVDPADVTELRLTVRQKSEDVVRWCQTPFSVCDESPPMLADPYVDSPPHVDELGQSTSEWPGKTESVDELEARLRTQVQNAGDRSWPDRYSRWGGDSTRQLDATGYFRIEREGEEWTLVDPDGHPFFSSGLSGVRPAVKAAYEGLGEALEWRPDPDTEFADACDDGPYDWSSEESRKTVNFLASNFVRAFDSETWYGLWAEVAHSLLRHFGFNTAGATSHWRAASKRQFPYVRLLPLEFSKTPHVYRDFPDVFHPSFEADVRSIAGQLRETAEDPALVGYFLGNEPSWYMCTASDRSLAEEILHSTETCPSRNALAEFLESRIDNDLGSRWEVDATIGDVKVGTWEENLTDAAKEDLSDFSAILVKRFYESLCNACAEVAPNHLNFGTRFLTSPVEWVVPAIRQFDALSVNAYGERVPDAYGNISQMLDLPIIVTEWSVGATDVGLPTPGLCEAENQSARSDQFRVYHEDAASKPWCIGSHFFRFYDMSSVGRADGETYNTGFLDVCNRPYEPMEEAAGSVHERLYDVTNGEVAPFDESRGVSYWM